MKGKRLREFVVKKNIIRETATVRTLGPLKETAKVGTSVLLKQIARDRPKNLQRTRGKVASSKEMEGNEVEEKKIRRKT